MKSSNSRRNHKLKSFAEYVNQRLRDCIVTEAFTGLRAGALAAFGV